MQTFVAIIEDDADDTEFVYSAIKASYKEVLIHTFSRGNEFLDFLKSAEHLPDLIITDIRMPVVTGFDVITSVKENPRTKAIPVVVLSTSGSKADMERARVLGAADYYVKPFTLEGFSAITDKIMEAFNKSFFSFTGLRIYFYKTFSFLIPPSVAYVAE